MSRPVTVVQYWAGCPKSPNSKWQRFLAIIRKCREQGWRNCLVWSKMPENSALAEPFREAGCEIIIQPRSRGNFDLMSVWRTNKLLRRLNCDVFHCYNDHTSPLIGAALAGVRVRLWSKRSMRSAFETMKKMTFRDRVAVSARLSSWLATKILAVSAAVKNELVSIGIPSCKIILCPNPVEVPKADGDARCQARAELGYTDDEIVFTTAGHAVPVKGWDILLGSFAKVIVECRKSRLQFVGSVADKYEQEHYSLLANCIQEYGIGDYVRFRGHQGDIGKILVASDVFVLPSRSEGYGNALIEAMTSGLPCIATKVGCATDVIQNGVNGLLVERGNERELTKAMITLAEDPKLRQQIAQVVQTKNKYAPTFAEYGEQLLEICKSLLPANRDLVHAHR